VLTRGLRRSRRPFWPWKMRQGVVSLGLCGTLGGLVRLWVVKNLKDTYGVLLRRQCAQRGHAVTSSIVSPSIVGEPARSGNRVSRMC
jgi:hypothetical protein